MFRPSTACVDGMLRYAHTSGLALGDCTMYLLLIVSYLQEYSC